MRPRGDATSADWLLCGMFVREALELVQSLAERFGRLYPKFFVAWRLMSEISIDVISSSPSASSSLSSTANGGTRQNERALTRERDRGLERGGKMCQVLEEMVERAEAYFCILVPRFGGFMDPSRCADVNSRIAVQENQQIENENQIESGETVD